MKIELTLKNLSEPDFGKVEAATWRGRRRPEMERLFDIKRKIDAGFYDDAARIREMCEGERGRGLREALGLDDPRVVHPESRGAAAMTIAVAAGGALLGAGCGAWALIAWLMGS